jgi:diguanylate cyclase (GGDEF)-like protein
LHEVGQFIIDHVRKSDQTCRYSGQQFAVMLVNASSEQTKKTCERFIRLLSEHPFGGDSSPVFVTASIGFVKSNPGLNESSGELLEMAAKALRKAKQNGKNRVEEFV